MRSGQRDLAVRGCRKRSHRQSSQSPASGVVSILMVGIKDRGVTLLSRGGGACGWGVQNISAQTLKFSPPLLILFATAHLKLRLMLYLSYWNYMCGMFYKHHIKTLAVVFTVNFLNIEIPCFTLLSTFWEPSWGILISLCWSGLTILGAGFVHSMLYLSRLIIFSFFSAKG